MRSGLYEQIARLPAVERAARLREILDDPRASRHVLLSPAQRQLWFGHRLVPDSTQYNAPAVYRFRGRIDLDALEQAIARLCRRHEVLRSRFVDVLGDPLVLISEQTAPFAVMTIDGPPGDREARWRAVVEQEANRPFRLDTESPLRVLVLVLADDDFVVVIQAHHIVMDGWSLDIFLSELMTECDGGAPPANSRGELQYIDYAAWQADCLAGDRLEDEIRHWERTLAGAPDLLDLPLDRRRPGRGLLTAASVTTPMPASVVASLTAAGRSAGASPFMVFLAAYAITLAAYSGQDDVLVGLPVAGRDRPELDGVIGMFVNTVVLRADLSADPTFAELARQVRRGVLDGRAHAEVPFDIVVGRLAPHRDLGRNPLFQAFFAYHPLSGLAFELAGVLAESVDTAVATTAFDVDLAVHARADGSADLVLTYASELFDEPTARGMVGYLSAVIRAGADAPGTPVSELSWIGDEERGSLTTAARPPLPASVACLHEFAELGAASHPAAIAVRHGEAAMTYAELDAAANRLAWLLRGSGVGPNVAVGVCLAKTPRLLVAILAILKAGGGYVPLDATLPDDALGFMVADSGIALLVTEDQQAGRLGGYHGDVVSLDAGANWLALCPATPLPAPAGGSGGSSPRAGTAGGSGGSSPRASTAGGSGGSNLAYVMYTSGSTGRPKGVAVEHASVVGLMEFYRTRLDAAQLAGMLGATPVGFDATILEYFLTLFYGGTIFLVDSLFDLHSLADQTAVTLIQTSPSLLKELMNAGPLPSGVTTILLSGEPLPAELVRRLRDTESVRWIYDIYGVTECTAEATWRIPDVDDEAAVLGEPLPGLRCYVLDDRRRLVPPGMRGELYLAGPAVARGYVGHEELTAERFLPDPFWPGERMYRTGDLVRRGPGGVLRYLGRADRQVKVHGCRVEPAEIETILREHPDVAEAAVVPRRTPAGDNELFAYVVPADGGLAWAVGGGRSGRDLRRYLSPRLPRYMMPAAVSVLERLPLNPNGKLDIDALPEIRLHSEGPGSQPRQGPRTDTERRVAAVWRVVLGREDVGIDDDFFALGGQSLLALRVVARIREEFGVVLPASVLFERTTVADLAEVISRGGATTPRVSLRVLRAPRDGGERAPLVVVHSALGTVLAYAELLRALSDVRPVYGIDPRGLDNDDEPVSSVPELARDYLALVAEAGLTGPPVLVGWSMGGAVVFEMARQAAALGAAASPVIIVDTRLGGTAGDDGSADDGSADDLATAVLVSQNLVYAAATGDHPVTDEEAAAGGIQVADLTSAERADPFEHLRQWARQRGYVGPEVSRADMHRLARVFAANMRGLNSYRPGPIDSPLLYIEAADEVGNAGTVLRDLANGHVCSTVVSGNHDTIMRPPDVAMLAQAIDTWLEHHEL